MQMQVSNVMIIGIGSVAFTCGAEFCWAFTDYVYKMKILSMGTLMIITMIITVHCILVFRLNK